MDLLAEYEEMDKLKPHIAVTYKFFAMFKVRENMLHWGQFHAGAIAEKEDDEAVGAIRAFLKEKRRLIQGGTLTIGQCSKLMWFFYEKLLSLGVKFSTDARREIREWMEICELVVT